MKEFHAVQVAYDIIEMQDELDRLRAEVTELKVYRDLYIDLLNDTINTSHSLTKEIVVNMLNTVER